MKKYIPFDFMAILFGSSFLADCSKDGNPESSGDIADSADLGLSVKWGSCNLGPKQPEGYGGSYWSSSLSTDIPRDASSLLFTSDEVKTRGDNHYCGFTVRPVEQE